MPTLRRGHSVAVAGRWGNVRVASPLYFDKVRRKVAAMFAGLRTADAVVVPGEIIETNATSVDGNRAAWVFDIEQDPDVIAKLQNSDLRVVFSGDGVALPGLIR